MRRKLKLNTHTTFEGVTFLLRVMMTLFLALVVTMVNPTKKDDADPGGVVMGGITVEAHWPDGSTADVDLWVRGPKDGAAVGYSRRSDKQFSYLRDDVGRNNDSTPLNFEFSAARGIFPGIYVVNLHLYTPVGDGEPLPVTAIASITRPGQGRLELATAVVSLTEVGQETTAFSFELDKDGALVPGSVAHNFIPLRSPGGPQ